MYGLRLRLAALGGYAAEPVHLGRIAHLEMSPRVRSIELLDFVCLEPCGPKTVQNIQTVGPSGRVNVATSKELRVRSTTHRMGQR